MPPLFWSLMTFGCNSDLAFYHLCDFTPVSPRLSSFVLLTLDIKVDLKASEQCEGDVKQAIHSWISVSLCGTCPLDAS